MEMLLYNILHISNLKIIYLSLFNKVLGNHFSISLIRVSYASMARYSKRVFYLKFDVDFGSGLHFDLTGLT